MKDIAMFEPYVSARARRRVDEVLASGRIGPGPVVAQFEKAFQEALGVPHAVALNSCTSALQLALSLAGVGPGDEVVTTPQTFIATGLAILGVGATPVFADIREETGNLDVADVERRIGERTKAILLVHWGGMPCDMDEIAALAACKDLIVIEDAAHAIGAEYRGRAVGTLSRLTCFSFQAIKHVTTGDGGMLAAIDANDAEKARRLRWHGIDRERRRPSILGEPEWDVSELGSKLIMNDIAAALGVEHLAELPKLLAERRQYARIYDEGLAGIAGLRLFERPADRHAAFWLYDVHVERREDLVRALAARGISASVVHRRIDRHSIFSARCELPAMERFDASHLCLPMHNGLSPDDAARVVEAVRAGW